MHQVVFIIVMTWLSLLVAALLVYTLLAKNSMDRILGLDTLALVFVASLSLLAVQYKEAGMLDIALVVAMLGFAQTVAATRLVGRRKDLR